jgi:hypothetical protein
MIHAMVTLRTPLGSQDERHFNKMILQPIVARLFGAEPLGNGL